MAPAVHNLDWKLPIHAIRLLGCSQVKGNTSTIVPQRSTRRTKPVSAENFDKVRLTDAKLWELLVESPQRKPTGNCERAPLDRRPKTKPKTPKKLLSCAVVN